MAPETNVAIPEPPAGWGMPEVWKKKWQAAYAAGLKQARIDSPNDESTQRQTALREANRILFVEPANYREAMALEDWQVMKREEVNGNLHVVTAFGRKYDFAVPARGAASQDQKKE